MRRDGGDSVAERAKVWAARWLRFLLPSVEVRLRHVEPGLTLRVNLRRHLQFWLWGTRRYEVAYVGALREAIGAGCVVYDVGANIGFYTVMFSRWVGPRGTVVAFEPDPLNLPLLRANVEANRCENVQVRPVAVGKIRGRRDFSLDLVTGCTSRLGSGVPHSQATLGDGRAHTVSVEVETIDDLVREGLAAPDVVKLDIEGGEGDALAGARETIRRFRPVIISELTDPEPVLSTLRESDYLVRDLDTGAVVQPHQVAWMVKAVPGKDGS